MPGKIKVRILGARHLPIMDRASELTDAFVEIKFGNQVRGEDVNHYITQYTLYCIVSRAIDICNVCQFKGDREGQTDL